MKNCIIIGGGIIGLCSAYYLAKEGHQVTVLDKSDMSDGCSYGNAGMIVPSHVIPLAQPGMIAQGIKWMFDSTSPFYVKPRLDRELINWGLKFYKHANQSHVEKAMPALRDLSLLSKELYKEFAKENNSFLYQEKGLLMLYKSDAVGEDILHEAKAAENLGLEVSYYSKEEIPSVEKGLNTNATGAVLYHSDAHLYPQKFLAFIKSELEKLGVSIQLNSLVKDFEVSQGKIDTVITTKEKIAADEVILCSGSWSPEIAKKLKLKLSILPGKGYSFSLKNFKGGPTIPSILCEGKVAVTPMGNDLRFGGTMEITHNNDTKINKNRLKGIVNSINEFYPDLDIQIPEEKDTWFGFRPCTPSGLPIISRNEKLKNLVIASGHAMMGLSLAPATGKLVQEIVEGKKLSVSNQLF